MVLDLGDAVTCVAERGRRHAGTPVEAILDAMRADDPSVQAEVSLLRHVRRGNMTLPCRCALNWPAGLLLAARWRRTRTA